MRRVLLEIIYELMWKRLILTSIMLNCAVGYFSVVYSTWIEFLDKIGMWGHPYHTDIYLVITWHTHSPCYTAITIILILNMLKIILGVLSFASFNFPICLLLFGHLLTFVRPFAFFCWLKYHVAAVIFMLKYVKAVKNCLIIIMLQ